MNLSDLKAVLGVKDIRTAPGQPAPEYNDSGLVAEIFARHRNSTQPESQQLCIILSAILEVIKGEGLQPSPTALFAALMSSLEKSDTLESTEITAGVCNLLSSVLPRVPNNVLKLKYGPASQLLLKVLESKSSESTVVRSALPCLVQILAAARPSEWAPAAPAFAVVLKGCLDSRPKIRKKSQSGLAEILAGLQGTSSLTGASEMVLKVCEQVLPRPETTARAAAEASIKKRQQAEEAITKAVADALHLIGALRQCLPLLSSSAVSAITELLLRLYPLHQTLLSQGVTSVLRTLSSSPATQFTSKSLASLLQAVLSGDVMPSTKDAEGALGFISLVEASCNRLHDLDSVKCLTMLPQAVHALVPLLASAHDSVRLAASSTLCSLLSACIKEDDVVAAVANAARSTTGAPTAVYRTIAAIESSLGPQYQDSWEGCLPVAAQAIEVLGKKGASLASGLTMRIGALCAGVDDAEEAAASQLDARLVMTAQSALGVALRALGPQEVLDTLPLGLEEGLDGQGEARTWLLPLMRQHVRESSLGYWTSDLLPLARKMGNRSAQASRHPAGKKEATVCATLESQIWALLPSFCSWAGDIPEAFPEWSTIAAAAFQKRPDLRTIICNSLHRMCTQTRAALRHHGHPVGHADPSNMRGDDDAHYKQLAEEEAVHVDVPDSVTLEAAQASLGTLRGALRTWLPLLLEAFVTTSPERRIQIEAAVSSYACLCESSMLAAPFRSAITKVIEAVQMAQNDPNGLLSTGDTPTEQRCTYMEAALSLAGGLDGEALQVLHKAAAQGIMERDPAVQKKSYKTLAYLCEARPEFLEANFPLALEGLLAGMNTSLSAAKRYRLQCLKAVILRLTQKGGEPVDLGSVEGLDLDEGADSTHQARQVVASMVSEIVLCVKEANKRTRSEAYALIVEVAEAMHAADPPSAAHFGHDEDMEAGPSGTAIGRSDQGGLHALFTMVLGGLVGSTPHMISASVMALARLLYDFAPALTGLVPDLLPAVLMLLRSKAREVIKSVLGFIKVVAVRLPVEDLKESIPSILEGILLWAEDSKNKFRLKVRVIIERLARRCGFEAVEPYMPEAHRALLVHIRKQRTRKDKRRDAESQMDWEEEEDDKADTRSRKSGATAKTAAGRSQWTDAVFSDEEGSEEGQTVRTKKTARTLAGRATTVRSAGRAASGVRLPAGGDPVDLLDASTSRRLVKAAAGKASARVNNDDDIKFEVGEGGRMVIEDEEDGGKKRKRDRDGGFDSDDSDFEDLKGFSGMSLALKGSKSVAMAPSIAASLGGKSFGGRSMGAKSMGGKSVGGRSQKTEGGRSRATHSGDRFKPKKGKAGGDVKGQSKVEPYAYWPLDRKLLNRRQQKTKAAKSGLDKIVNAAKEGAQKGAKAQKRMRR